MSSKIPITFVDLETTGFNPENHEIIEVAAIRTSVDEKTLSIEKTFHRLVDPDFVVDPLIRQITGYSKKEWKDATLMRGWGSDKYINSQWERSLDSNTMYKPPYRAYIWDAIGGVFECMRGAWHAGSNPAFDASFLKKWSIEFNWEYPSSQSYHVLDVTLLGFPLLLRGDIKKLKQHDLAMHYDLGKCKHRAIDDATQCMQVFAKINNLKIVDNGEIL